MAKLTFNRNPYYDDFDESKNFYRILFRPSRAIQTRELNQLQAILSSQTETFANHIFKFGSMVKSGSVRFQNNRPYVRLKDLTPAGDAIDLSYFTGRYAVGRTSGLRALVLVASPKDTVDPATIIVDYKNTAVDGETTAFVDGETIEILDDQGYVIYEAVVRCPACVENPDADIIDPTGFGSIFVADESTYYIHGYMVPVEHQTIILNKYDTTPSYKVGFDIVQTIVTADTDISLLDNALGTPNFVAPGADRYRINLVLTKKPLDDDDDENFVLLARCDLGVLQELNDKPQYSEIMTTLARRTHDESGDYTVHPFRINFREHLNTGTNDGFRTEEQGGDSTKFITVVSPGKAYVRGYEVEFIADSIVEVNKARDSESKRLAVVRAYMGNYITIAMDPISNTLPITDVPSSDDFAVDFEKVLFYDGATDGGNYTGNQIGSARVKNLEKISGTAGVDAVYALYIFEIVMATGKTIQDVVGIHRSGGGNQTFAANIVPDVSDDVTNKVYDPNTNKLLYGLPYRYTRTVRDADNPLVANTTVTVAKKLVGAVNSANKVVFSAEGDEFFLDYDPRKWIGGLQVAGPGGNFTEYDISATDILITSPSELTIQNFDTAHVGKNFVLICEVLKGSAKEKTKVLTTQYLSAIPGDTNHINLQKADVFKIVKVTDVTDTEPVDVTDNYVIDEGIKDNYYGIGGMDLRAGLITPEVGTLLDVEFQYFHHVGTGYYFSIDSYNGLINDPEIDFDYEDVPIYTANDGTKFRMSDTLDFRPTIGTTGDFASSGALLSNIPVDDSNITFDIGYYLNRIDLLTLHENGQMMLIEGDSDLNPKAPKVPDNTMPLYQIVLSPYTFNLRNDVRQVYVDNKRYTMRDIGKLEKRIENLEYYVTFNLLEKATADQSILDASGNTRFKNGFLVDNFRDFVASDTSSLEYSVSIDIQRGELRPSFIAKSVQVVLDETLSSHWQQSSKVLTLPYEEVLWLDQPFATKTVSVNPYFIFSTKGQMTLNPSNDVWQDMTTEPNIVNDIDTGFEALQEVASAAGVLGTTWGSWEITNESTRSQSSTRSRTTAVQNEDGTSGTRTSTTRSTFTRTTVDEERLGINREIESQIQEKDLGTFITAVTLIPFCRSMPIEFIATGMKPNTRVYAFFDDVNVDAETRPLNGADGDPLVTDANGDLGGVFTLPNREDKRFFVGSRIFRFTNMLNDSRDPDELVTTASAQYHAGGLNASQQTSILSVETPIISVTELQEERSTTSTTFSSQTTFAENGVQQRGVFPRRVGPDPLAQTFKVTPNQGIFLTSCDVYMNKTDSVLPMWFEIRETVNGYPGPLVIPFSHSERKPENIMVSDDGSVPTRFTFPVPVYLLPDLEYCIVIGSDSEAYRTFTCKLGNQTLGANPVTVSSQPNMGSLFKSQNNSTWTAEQFEDLKFTLHRAKFDISESMKLKFANTEIGLKSKLPINAIETETASRDIRIHFPNHGLVPNDKVHLELLQDTEFECHLITGNLVVGQQLTGGTNGGKAIVRSLTHPGPDGGGNDVYKVKLSGLDGFFADGEQFTGPVFYEEFSDVGVMAALDYSPTRQVHNVAIGSFPTGVDNIFNGVPLTDLSEPDHLVKHVDHMDSFVVQVATPATASGRVGGDGAYAFGNIQTDAFEFQMTYIDFEGNGKFNVASISHGAVGSNVTNYGSLAPYKFVANETRFIPTPIKVASPINETINLGGESSMIVNVTLESSSDFISPVVNLEQISFTTITNRIDWNTCANFSVAPNADTEGNPVICDDTDPAYTGTQRWKVENSFDGGSEGAKYIMKPVNLDNPATNIKVYMDLLDFLDTEVQMFYRILPSESDDEIKNMEWVQTYLDAETVSETETDYKEAEITIPLGPLDVLPEFKAFQVKLILRTKNTARPPKVKNFRALAIT